MRWDACNKWLYFGRGDRWTLRLDEWLCWTPGRSWHTWSLFHVMWDRGSWPGIDLDNALVVNGRRYGKLDCFVDVSVMGVGFRRWYWRKVVFDEDAYRRSFTRKEAGNGPG